MTALAAAAQWAERLRGLAASSTLLGTQPDVTAEEAREIAALLDALAQRLATAEGLLREALHQEPMRTTWSQEAIAFLREGKEEEK